MAVAHRNPGFHDDHTFAAHGVLFVAPSQDDPIMIDLRLGSQKRLAHFGYSDRAFLARQRRNEAALFKTHAPVVSNRHQAVASILQLLPATQD